MSDLFEKVVTPPATRAFTWLHLSDLHFGQARGDGQQCFDQEKVVSEILIDVTKMKALLGAPDVVVVTGDVAFSAKTVDYKRALEWFLELCGILAIGPERLLIVPGNHDVDRDAVSGDETIYDQHQGMRKKPSKLDNLLDLKKSGMFGELLWPKFAPFAKFVADLGATSISSPEQPFWVQELFLDNRAPLGAVRAVGLNTCLLSFDNDDKPSNLALGAGQVFRLFKELPCGSAECRDDERSSTEGGTRNAPAEYLVLAIMHHPPSWLCDSERLEAELTRHPHIVFAGHTHKLGGQAFISFAGTSGLTLNAGAAQVGVGEGILHACAWGRLSKSGLDYWPRVWNPDIKSFQPERNRVPNADEDGRVHWQRAKLPDRLEAWVERAVSSVGSLPDVMVTRDSLGVWRTHLDYLRENYSYIQLHGIQRPGGAAKIPLERVYVELRAQGGMRRDTVDRRGSDGVRSVPPGRAHPGVADDFCDVLGGAGLRDRAVSLHEALACSPRAAIVGDPGSGKTTLLRFVARTVASGLLEAGVPEEEARDLLKLKKPAVLPVPLLCTLGALSRFLKSMPPASCDTKLSRMVGFLAAELQGEKAGVSCELLEKVLDWGEVLLLLDGLDEVPGHQERLTVSRAVAELVSRYPKVRLVLTSRTRAWTAELEAALGGLVAWQLLPMSPEEQARFLSTWFKAVYEGEPLSGATAERKTGELLEEIAAHSEVALIATNPNILTLIAILKHTRTKLPERRVDLYRETVDLFLEYRESAKEIPESWEQVGLKLELPEKRLLLSRLAFEMHGGGEAGRTASPKAAMQVLARLLEQSGKCATESEARLKAERLLDWLELRTGLLVRRDEGVQFVHLGYQECAT